MRPRQLLWVGIAAWATGLSALSVLRHRAFETGRFDLGNMVQAVWSTAHGRFLETTNLRGEQISRLASHFDPVLAAFAPLWLVWPSPDLLLVVQAAAIAVGALPVFRLARRHLDSERTALGVALAYLLYPATQWLALNEFHPVALACPLLLFAFDYLDQDRLVLFAVCAAAAVCCKEEVGLVLAGFGIWYALARGKRLAGAAVAVGGATASLLAVEVIVPHFHSGPSGFTSYYRHAGPGDALTARDFLYLGRLLLPFAALPLLAPLVLVAALPELVLNTASSNQFQSSIRFHYTAGLIPPLVVASVLGAARLGRTRPALLPNLAKVLVLLGVIATGTLGLARLEPILPDSHDRLAARALRLVPDDAVVSATNSLGAHLSARRRILSFPLVTGAAWIAVDRQRPSYLYGTSRPRFEQALQRLRAGTEWRAVLEADGLLILRRVSARSAATAQGPAVPAPALSAQAEKQSRSRSGAGQSRRTRVPASAR
jgi:uncharacterized membrane protein